MAETVINEESDSREANAEELREQGLSYRAIAKKLGLSEATIRRKLKADEGENGNGNGHGNGNGNTKPEIIADTLTGAELLRRARVVASSEDPAVIVPLLTRLQTRQERLATLIEREKQNATTASKQIEKLAVLVAEKDKPEDEQKLAVARADLASATALIAALNRERAALTLPLAELFEAAERRQASVNEQQQNVLLMESHNLIESAQREFFRKMDDAVSLLRKAGETGKSWNEKAQSYKLPIEFGTRGIEAMKELCSKVTALSSQGTPVASVRVKLGPTISYQMFKGGEVAAMPAFQARHMVEEHPEYQCQYVETVEQ